MKYLHPHALIYAQKVVKEYSWEDFRGSILWETLSSSLIISKLYPAEKRLSLAPLIRKVIYLVG